jgi:hypothetical protein
VVTVFSLKEYAVFQIMILMYFNLVFNLYIGYCAPYQSRYRNRIEIMNELQVTFICYHTIIFTDFVKSVEDQYLAGWIMICLVNLLLLLNMGIVFHQIYYNGRLYCIRVCNKCFKKPDLVSDQSSEIEMVSSEN